MRSLSLLFLAQLCNIETIFGHFRLNTCVSMIFCESATIETNNKLHVVADLKRLKCASIKEKNSLFKYNFNMM